MDRQDIDALLIGALYGELLPAEEVRLAAHLESHPTDRSAFEGLKSARQAVRESRIFEVQLEPPQALSALLLQEAHRRAPREARDGWFQRLVRSFAAHPALAAAAMLAIVLGFAGLMSRRGATVADQQRAETTTAVQAAVSPTGAASAAATPPNAPESGAMAGSGYVVGLADNADEAKDDAVQQATAGLQRQDANDETRAQAAHQTSNVAALAGKVASAPGHAKAKTGGIVVRGEEHEPKDLDGLEAGDEGYAGGGAAATDQRAAKVAAPTVDKLASPPAPPPVPAQAAAAESQGASFGADRPAAAPGAPAPAAHTAAVSGTAWARARHTAAVGAVQHGDCAGAANIALAVKQREPAFYDQVMATDRALAKCQAYIASEIERDLEARKAAARVQATDQK